MFERRNAHAPTSDDNASNQGAQSVLTTDEILRRVQHKTRMPLGRLALWASLALGLLGIIILSIATVMQEQWEIEQHERAAHARAQAQHATGIAPLPNALAPTAVIIKLSHAGSVFIDGRYVGMQRRLLLELAPGEHALLVRFGHHSYTQSLHIGHASGCVHCDVRTGCHPFKPRAAL